MSDNNKPVEKSAIEKMEEMMGGRWDANEGDNPTMTALYGLVAGFSPEQIKAMTG